MKDEITRSLFRLVSIDGESTSQKVCLAVHVRDAPNERFALLRKGHECRFEHSGTLMQMAYCRMSSCLTFSAWLSDADRTDIAPPRAEAFSLSGLALSTCFSATAKSYGRSATKTRVSQVLCRWPMALHPSQPEGKVTTREEV